MSDFVGKASEKLKKLSDEQVERLIATIQEENDIFDSILESLSSGIIVVDRNWKIIKSNKSVKRLVPLFSHYREKNDAIWNLIDNDEISSFLKKTASDNVFNVNEEFSIVSENSVTFIDVSVLPLVKNSEIAGSIILISDITAKRQQEILLHRMDSLQSLTNLAASVAHEIKNPLGAISIHIQLLQKAVKKCRAGDGNLPDEKFMEKYLEVVNEEIDNLNRIVMDFLFAVRPVKSQLILSNPDEVIGKTVEFFRPEMEENKITLNVDLCKETRLLIDEKLLREVVVNLVQNAKAAVLSRIDEDGARIVVKSLLKNDRYILTVADNGCGMDHETCDHVFEPYYTTKSNGTGLGLTTVYKIIKEFRGEISVTSELYRGTVFTVSLPVPQKSTMLLEGGK
ncbi:two-component system sensor histidine kinase NtrB [Treponema sp.]|uniref:two-component system sensor histidine kinase NtrB n=1 Tax=Treponema sp. TaxID=166 RepID=UPI00298EAAFF|nr:ATP-binding protein [Treponema sp.]MCQ2242518.1 ATP-binding protein [Treponema sp.]